MRATRGALSFTATVAFIAFLLASGAARASGPVGIVYNESLNRYSVADPYFLRHVLRDDRIAFGMSYLIPQTPTIIRGLWRAASGEPVASARCPLRYRPVSAFAPPEGGTTYAASSACELPMLVPLVCKIYRAGETLPLRRSHSLGPVRGGWMLWEGGR